MLWRRPTFAHVRHSPWGMQTGIGGGIALTLRYEHGTPRRALIRWPCPAAAKVSEYRAAPAPLIDRLSGQTI